MAIPIRDNHWRQIPHPLRQYYIISWAHNQNYLSHFLWMQCIFFRAKKHGPTGRTRQSISGFAKSRYLEAGLSKQNQYKDLIGFVSWILLDYDIRSQTILREREVFIFFVHASLVCHLCASSSSILKWDGAWAVLCL